MISSLLDSRPTLSFEFFPPRTDEAERTLEAALSELVELRPHFVSVTYGALGSTQERTRELVVRINAENSFPAMAHLTCVGHTRAQIRALLDEYAEQGVHNILALGGDPPAAEGPQGEFRHAIELVEMVRDHPGRFSVGVAAHPELHPRSRDRSSDRQHLARKLSLADFAITQFFFRVEDYLRMVEELASLGCDRPVLPGVMPVINVAGLRRMAAMNNSEIPPELDRRLDPVVDDPEEVLRIGVEVATDLGRRLLERGAPGLHLYTLNRSRSVRAVCANLGLGAA